MKYIKISTILILSLILTSCSESSIYKNTQTEKEINNKDIIEEEVQKETEDPKGQALIETLDISSPESYILELERNIAGAITKYRISIMGDYSKIETLNNVSSNPTIILFNPQLDSVFQFIKGNSVGMKFHGIRESNGNIFRDKSHDFSGLNLGKVKDLFDCGFIARKEIYKEQETIYVEGSISNENHTEEIKMWYSEDFFLPIKYEIYYEKKLIISSELISINKEANLSEEDFQPPEGVEFQEVKAR